METSLELFPLSAMLALEGDSELEKLTKQNTLSNRNIPILNSDLEADARTYKRLVSSKKPRVRFSESCTIIPSAFDSSTYTFRKIRASTPFGASTRSLRTHSEEEHSSRQTHSSRLAMTLSEAELYVSHMDDTRTAEPNNKPEIKSDSPKTTNSDQEKEM